MKERRTRPRLQYHLDHASNKGEHFALADDLAWLNRFDPDKKILRGKAYERAKRLLDIAIVVLAAPFWLPWLLIIAALMKLMEPRASVFFVQWRTGKGGRRFKMYKFRTMVPDAEELKIKLMHLNELQWPDFKITNDPRVTRLGHILRKTSLDELPQVFNVLLGDMSLVGPRPTSFSPRTYSMWHTERLDIVPGLTGLWQITGRGSSSFDERVRLDVAYMERRCLWLDIHILARTVLAVFQQKGAY
ncbi:MAG TPA: sugar transferase [Chloroflexi bacterium]|nr:sugar transferase [Chloroflexota bacterium]